MIGFEPRKGRPRRRRPQLRRRFGAGPARSVRPALAGTGPFRPGGLRDLEWRRKGQPQGFAGTRPVPPMQAVLAVGTFPGRVDVALSGRPRGRSIRDHRAARESLGVGSAAGVGGARRGVPARVEQRRPSRPGAHHGPGHDDRRGRSGPERSTLPLERSAHERDAILAPRSGGVSIISSMDRWGRDQSPSPVRPGGLFRTAFVFDSLSLLALDCRVRP